MTIESKNKFPIMFGDGRTRFASEDFIKDSWKATWDSLISTREGLRMHLDDPKTEARARKMMEDIDAFLAANPELTIPADYYDKIGKEYGWPEWYKKIKKSNKTWSEWDGVGKIYD
ncbi:MAG TPA: hypothetical protein VI791_03615 [Patescibacteria group bacterium]|nr:hypothetical protein [Patescibacteria group bacterium]